MQSTVLVMAFK